MKKIITFIIFVAIVISGLLLFMPKQSYVYSLITPNNEVYSQYNDFDIYNIKAFDKDNNNLMDNVVVYGLELLNIKNNRITEFGTFSLRYTIEIDGDVVAHAYRVIKVIYEKNSFGGFIYNGDFYSGTKEWGIVDWKSSLDINVENEKLYIYQNSVDEYIWDQSIYQYVVGLEINKTYEISFYASSSFNKTLKVCLAQTLSDSPWSYNIMNENDIEINNSLSLYTIEFTCTLPTNIVNEFEFDINQVRLEFKFGKYNLINNENSTICFSNINIKEK